MPLKVIFISFLATMAACSVLFSDLFWRHDQSFLWHHDAEIPYMGVFYLISNFFQGGLQLFDRYDGMTLAFTQLGHGLYTISNIGTAFIYIVLSPFQSLPGFSYQHIFSFFFPVLNILIRLIGGYVLLKKFKLSNGVIIISLVILNTFLSTTMYFGFVANNAYSYFPLLAYFIITYCEKFRVRDLAVFMVLFMVAVSGNPLLTVGYFYQNVHFLIITALIYGIIFHRNNISLPTAFAPKALKEIGIAIIVSVCIILPCLLFFNVLGKDFFVEGSGLSGTHGRFSRMFNPAMYFAPKGETILPLADLPIKLIDFTNAAWEKSWIFWGASVVVLIIMALICSRIRQKYIFVIASVLVLLTNVPLNNNGPLSIAHWINALTNPFSFLLRSYHMPILLLPYLIFPLVAFGLQSGWDLINGLISQNRSRVLLAVYAGILFLSAWFLPFELKAYMLVIFTLAMLFVHFSVSAPNLGRNKSKVIMFFLFSLMMVCDFYALKEYYDSNQYRGDFANRGGYLSIKDGRHIKPSVYDGFEDKRSLLIDYQNPKILPYREYFRILPSATDPHMHTFQGPYGYFFHYMPLERFLGKVDIYEPRPKIYQDWGNNRGLIFQLAQDQRFLSLAIGTPEGPRQMLPSRERQFNFRMNQARAISKGKVNVFAIKLPKNFPSYEATGIFTQDRERISLEAGGNVFSPVQGAISEPFTFDVNNIKSGSLVFSLPQTEKLEAVELKLKLIQSGDIINVWRNRDDQLGVTFKALNDGWLITHYPYDSKWQVTIDGKKVATSKVQGYFLGVPITAGEHQILFNFWPHSPLRVLLPISILLSFAVLFWVIRQAFKSV